MLRVMRRAFFVLAGAAALSACHKEPSFEERYDAASEKIEQRAKAIDAQISGTGTPPAENAAP
ncbi:hypothetical protein [Novosphingobium sp. TCA1]|uniref:hypothetical protein n=1 Tax=Novosphingobium sp. TCA1 TaxID=2682474 RepID=UPI00130A826B|nr:hypothetical protein [Novosphingobium sp. TCA1]GFE74223.1 hypothetical protein NTCA1_18720 [Novosphingobium sp. TCA1]